MNFHWTDHNAQMIRYAQHYHSQGIATCLVYPDSKRPFDARPLLDNTLSSHGYKANTRDIDEFSRWAAAAQQHGHLNLNVALYLSTTDNLVVADVDTAAGLQYLQSFADPGQPIDLTVSSPGVKKGGRRVHGGGGHVYFRLPEGMVKESLRTVVSIPHPSGKREDAIDLKIHGTTVTAPPSVRAEGPYQFGANSAPQKLPQKLLTAIMESQSHRQREKSLEAVPGAVSSIYDTWGREHPWTELMDEAGWDHHGYDSCGCPVFTRPGTPGSPRSAVGHEEDCLVMDAPVLVVYSSEASGVVADAIALYASQGSYTTKIGLVAALYYDGDMDRAKVGEGLSRQRFRVPSSAPNRWTKCSFSSSSEMLDDGSAREKSRRAGAHRPNGYLVNRLRFISIEKLTKIRGVVDAFVKENRATSWYLRDAVPELIDCLTPRNLGVPSELHSHRMVRDTPAQLLPFVTYALQKAQSTDGDDFIQLTEYELWALLSKVLGESRVTGLWALLGEVSTTEFLDRLMAEYEAAEEDFRAAERAVQRTPSLLIWPYFVGRLRDRSVLEIYAKNRWEKMEEEELDLL